MGCQYARLKPSLPTSTRACFGVFLALGVGGLILAHPGLYPRETAYILLSAATALAWVAVVARKWRRREQFIPPRILVGTAALWATGAILSVSLNADASWNPLLFLGSQLQFLWIGWWLAADRNALKTLAVSFLAGTALAGLWAIVQHYYHDPFLHSTQPEDRIVSVFANPNYFGNYMAAAMPLALASVMQAGDRRLQVASCLLTGLVYAGLLLTASRGAWFASLGGCLVLSCGFIRTFSRKGRPRRIFTLLALFLLLFAITFLLNQKPSLHRGGYGPVSIPERFFSTKGLFGNSEPYSTINHRYFIWKVSWEMIRTSPILGLGYGSYRDHFVFFRDHQRETEHFETLSWAQQNRETLHAHNEYLQVWVESGLLGLLGFVGLVGAGCLRTVQHAWNAGRGGLYAWAVVSMITVMLVHSLVSYPLRLTLNGMVFFVLLGIGFRSIGRFSRIKYSNCRDNPSN